jgi:hypothetical protein
MEAEIFTRWDSLFCLLRATAKRSTSYDNRGVPYMVYFTPQKKFTLKSAKMMGAMNFCAYTLKNIHVKFFPSIDEAHDFSNDIITNQNAKYPSMLMFYGNREDAAKTFFIY